MQVASEVEDGARQRVWRGTVTVSSGVVVYRLDGSSCSGIGLRWSVDDLNLAMDGRVASVLFDNDGKANIEEILAGVVGTDFAHDGLRRLLDDPEGIQNWRVGEAIAASYLIEHRSCSFPWPAGRDERKRGSSLPGADLVGFGSDSHGDCFAFGEVKTSSDRSYPPRVMYGHTGWKRQLEGLRDDNAVRDDLVKYLGHRAETASWKERFKHAGSRYLRNSSDVQIYGFLVRDVEPRLDDLRARVGQLGEGCPVGMRIELIALYLPQESLDAIGRKVISRQAGSGS